MKFNIINFKKYWYIFALIFIAALSFGLNFYAISKIGFGNAYYAAAIRSMTQSFQNFFFLSFDPAGVVSVDKPPLGLWIQAIFVLIFGYHGWAMLLPQALAGTGACLLMYALVSRYFGRPAGLVSALIFALTPVVVVAARNNTMDMQLIFVLLAAAFCLFRSLETGRWRWLFGAALLVGLGFNIKMLQAYMILPAIALVYLIFAREKFYKRILAGLISVVIVGAVSFAWVMAVELYPADQRPYVGSSSNNSELELIMDHNGLERVLGRGGGGGGGGQRPSGDGAGGGNAPSMQQDGTANGAQQDGAQQDGARQDGARQRPDGNASGSGRQMPGGGPPQGDGQNGGQNGGGRQMPDGGANARGGGGGGGTAGNEIGTAGALRLWSTSMYGQVSWLILFALFSLVVFIRKPNLKKLTLSTGMLAFFGLWLLIMYLFFSFGGYFHRYYLCMMAPAIAGLAGPGFAAMCGHTLRKKGWKRWLLPAAFLSTFAVELVYVWQYAEVRRWLAPVMIVFAAAALILTALHTIRTHPAVMRVGAGCMLAAMLAGPLYWSSTAMMYVSENITMPYAGPELATSKQTPGMTPNQQALNTSDTSLLTLEKYLVANYKEGSYLVVGKSSNEVSQFIVDTGLPAIAYGGFIGSDNALTLAKVKLLVAQGKITYFLISGQGQSMGGGNSDINSYVTANATLVDPSEYGGQTGSSRTSLYYFAPQ